MGVLSVLSPWVAVRLAPCGQALRYKRCCAARLLAAVQSPLSRRAAAPPVSLVIARRVLGCAGPQELLLLHARPANRRRLYIPFHRTAHSLARGAGHNTSLAQRPIRHVLTYATRLGRGHFPGCHAHTRAVIPSVSGRAWRRHPRF